MTPLLVAERVTARHRGAVNDAVRDVSLHVSPGEIVALLGPNGSGKSTLLAALGAELPPRSGRVLLDGEDARRVRRRDFARRVARLPQEPACPEGLRVESLVLSGRHPHMGPLSRAKRRDREVVQTALSAMSLLDMARRPVERLSGGERRRAWIAMALAQEPDVLLLDEPTSALDLRHQWEVIEALRRLSRDRGLAVVASLHDLEQAASVAHRVAVMNRGRLYDMGAPERCLREEMLRDVFRVDARLTKEDGLLRMRVQGPADPIRSF